MWGPQQKKQKTEHSANWPFPADAIVTVEQDGATVIYDGPKRRMTILLPPLSPGTHIQLF